MNFYNALQAVVVVGVSAFLYFKFKNSIVPNVAGFIDDAAGTAFRGILVPEGPNAFVVEYWSRHGIDYNWFMDVARGDKPIPPFIKMVLPDTVTVGLIFNALFSWANATTIGDVESYLGCGLPGKAGTYITNDFHYADAIVWKTDTLELIMNTLQEENLWDVVV